MPKIKNGTQESRYEILRKLEQSYNDFIKVNLMPTTFYSIKMLPILEILSCIKLTSTCLLHIELI